MRPVNRICKRRRQAVNKTSFFHTERIAFRFFAMAGVAASDIHALRMTLIIAVIHAFACFAVNGDRFTRVIKRASVAVPFSVAKALAAGVLAFFRLTSAHHDIAFAAIAVRIVGTIDCGTF